MKQGRASAMWRSPRAGTIALALLLVACEGRRGQPDPAPPDPLAPLHDFEEAARGGTDFVRLPASDHAFGADPYRIRALPGEGPPRFVALLRGRDAIVLLDASLAELGRLPAPASPTGLAVSAAGEIFVSGEQSPAIARYRMEKGALLREGEITVPGALALKDVAVGPDGVLHAVEAHDGRLFSIPLDHPEQRASLKAGHGAFRVARTGAHVLVDTLLDHRLSIFPVDSKGMPVESARVIIEHDGPIWGFDALDKGGDLWILAGGVEDHPLDRTGGSFGYIDSFVFLYRLPAGAPKAERISAINVSVASVITPKALALRDRGEGLSATVAGYGNDRVLAIDWSSNPADPPALHPRRAVPGIHEIAPLDRHRWIGADPLFDGFVLLDGHAPEDAEPRLVPVADPSPPAPPPSPVRRLGEALFYTTLMAPYNHHEGALSRFTCETCHFEGQVDGRTHHTGRGDVHATTKPLLGLFNNRPHFSRALDPDLTVVANAEFRVAGALSDHDPWFTATTKEAAWLPLLGLPESAFAPLELRRALMMHLMAATHRPNPAVVGRSRFSEEERRGAEVFAARCERCHAARVVSDDLASRQAREAWEGLIFRREGPIVWGRDGYEKTGVMPYVHEEGARTPSLRRLYAKWPYFTNGSAKDLGSVLDRVRFGEGKDGKAAFFHDAAPAGLEALSADEKKALLAFLDLL
ncbi:MAG: hypothetical protein U0359_10575 [Byssovorax sp.]